MCVSTSVRYYAAAHRSIDRPMNNKLGNSSDYSYFYSKISRQIYADICKM